MSDELKACPECNLPYGYPTVLSFFVYPECDQEWNPEELAAEENTEVKDANDNVLHNLRFTRKRVKLVLPILLQECILLS